MTVEKNVRIIPAIPAKRRVSITARVGEITLIAEIRENDPTLIHSSYGSTDFRLDADGLDAMIELLHAVKNDAAEQAGVDVHTIEPTA